ncbi:hypothetical protein EKO04_011416 [Ascochyta lentis]|uniref:RING-type domain-containing protein n=1 Tax=Ascochyta lentis TaxID=205686 RepID=A0A8H7ISP0_9PLEO|nr:hypothetical protein EKO04_011416 [Ascochyta lentis]
MSSISSRSVSHASISTLGHQWEPQQVLGLHDDGRCVGHAPSMGRKCRNPINKVNLSIFDNIVNELSLQPLDAALLRPDLERLARRGLCLRNHQGQVDDMVRKWVQKIKDAVCRLIPSARRTATDTQSRTDTRGTTDSFATARSNRTPGPRRANPSPPISSPPTSSLSTLQSEAEILERSIATMQQTINIAMRRLQQLQPRPPIVDIAPSTARVPTSGIPSLHLSRAPSTASTASLATSHDSGNATDPLRSPSLGRSIPSPYSSLLYEPPATGADRGVAFDWDSDSGSDDDFRPLPPLTFDLIRRHISQFGAPVLPASAQTATAPTRSALGAIPCCTATHVRRLPLSDECPICYSGEPLSAHPAPELIWCTSSCGRTVHKSCFNDWRTQCLATGRDSDCPVCRADWDRSCACGGLSNCTSVHAHRKATSSPCPVCREDMKDDEQLEWCKDSCGQNVHKECADAWAAQRLVSGRRANCTVCRAPWVEECGC